ncbi:MAG: GGDEF domain-containing protein [Actinobacteria bacterium]|nr:GGDEF domain-containing protein [Actinomycetota bacterium]
MASRVPEIPRARFRVLHFTLLAVACAVAGWWPAVGLAAACVGAGIVSVLVAHSRGRDLALTFVTVDWLCVGIMTALTGGLRSPLMYTLPILVACHLLPTDPSEWSRVLAPSLAGLAVLLIADPSLGGSRLLGAATFAGLLLAGCLPPLLVRRRFPSVASRRRTPRRRRQAAGASCIPRVPATVDATTGFHGLSRVADLVTGIVRDATRLHEAVGIVCIRLVSWQDLRDVRGELAAEAAAAAAARHIRRHIGPLDVAFRVSGDTFLLALRDRTTSQAQAVAAELQAALAAHRVERSGRRLTAVSGVSSYPATRSLQELLQLAADGVVAVDELDTASSR